MWIGFVVVGALVASVAIAMIFAYSCYLCDLIRHHSRLTSINDDEKFLMGSINRSTYKFSGGEIDPLMTRFLRVFSFLMF